LAIYKALHIRKLI